jgi:hypothetical protein
LSIQLTEERALLDAANRGHEIASTTGQAPPVHAGSPGRPPTGTIGF